MVFALNHIKSKTISSVHSTVECEGSEYMDRSDRYRSNQRTATIMLRACFCSLVLIPIPHKIANADTIHYVSDDDNRLIAMTYPGGEQETYFYDGGGLLVRKVTPNNDTLRYGYNPAGALMSVKGGTGPGAVDVSYTRDAAGAVMSIADPVTTISYAWDGFGRMTSAKDSALNKTLSYSYDLRGLRTGMAGDIPMPVQYSFDDAMRLKTVTQGALAPAVYSYDSAGLRLKLALPNGVETDYVHDAQDRLLSLTTKKGASVLSLPILWMQSAIAPPLT